MQHQRAPCLRKFGKSTFKAAGLARIRNSSRALRLQPAYALLVSGKAASPLVIEYETQQGPLYIGIDGPLRRDRAGNGGLRISAYPHKDDAVEECRRLAATMSHKHEVYNTGFSGAKLVFATQEPQGIDKESLLKDVSRILHELDGSIYTGCDVNTSQQDMETLTKLCPYVLASVGCPTDASIATGHGVFAAIQGVADFMGGLKGKRCFVKGCGKVGATVAELLVAAGAEVITYDIDPARADILGAKNVSQTWDWKDVECDIFVPCSISRFIDEELAARIACKAVVGSCNAPFTTTEAMNILESRGVIFIHEAITSAGAVLADSIEHFSTAEYRAARPSIVYAFIRKLVRSKVTLLMELRANLGRENKLSTPIPCSQLLDDVKTDAQRQPIGEMFAPWVASQTTETDVVVIGGGMAGTAAAYWLSKEAPQYKGVVLEQATVAHEGGSSYGKSRMYREMYSDPYFAKMQRVALDMWHQLEAESGTKLLKQNGLLFYGEADTGETVEGSIQGAKAVMEAAGLPHEHLATADLLQEKFPALTAHEGQEGLYEGSAGSINSSLACATMMSQAAATGRWSLQEDTRVEDVFMDENNQIYVVTSDCRIIKGSKLVIAAGAWTNKLLSHIGYQLDLEVWRVHWGHARVEENMTAKVPQWFHFRKPGVQGPEDGGLYYGFPAEDPSQPIVKVGVDFTPEAHKSRSMDGFDYTPDAEVTQHIDKFMRQHLKGYKNMEETFVSPYTMSSDNYFILDKLPGAAANVAIFTGGSGRAFKFAPLIGRCLADLVLDRQPVYDIQPLSLQRDAAGLKHISTQQGSYPQTSTCSTSEDTQTEHLVADQAFGMEPSTVKTQKIEAVAIGA